MRTDIVRVCFDAFKDVLKGAGHNSFKMAIVWDSHHGMSLSGGGLTISKNCGIETIHCGFNNVKTNVFVNFFIVFSFIKNTIKHIPEICTKKVK